MNSHLLIAVCLTAGLAAFSNAKAEGEGGEEKADQRLGEEVSRICFPRNINGWKTIKGEDNVLLLEEGVNDWYRVELLGACRYSDLRFTQTIALESRPSGGCVTRGDVITLIDRSSFNRRCTITQINEWDDKAPAPSDEEEPSGEEQGA